MNKFYLLSAFLAFACGNQSLEAHPHSDKTSYINNHNGTWTITYQTYANSICRGTLSCKVKGTSAICHRNPLPSNTICLQAFGYRIYTGTVTAKKIDKVRISK